LSTSDSNNNSDFFAQFLDDYYAECDEHLTLVRRHLLALETQVEQPRVDQALLDELFRSFHTLKGISGMVGLSAAEQLAHQMESYLRALRQGEVTLSTDGVEALIAGASMLEQVISARRNEQALPEIERVVLRLEAVASNVSSQPAEDSSGHTVADARPRASDETKAEAGAQLTVKGTTNQRTWHVEFVPTPALAEQGINVNSIRAHLQEIGELVQAKPQVRGQGEIAFLFVVVTSADEAVFASWGIDNLTFAPVDEEALASGAAVPEATAAAQEAGAGSASDVQSNSQSAMLAPSNVVRVELSRLDELMRMIGELVSSRARMEDQLKRLQASVSAVEWRTLQETSLAMSRQLRALRDGVMRVRMVQVGEIFERMQFVVRDLTRESGKRIALELLGQETEIDKFLVERMTDPLMHLVRNAVSHGLETAFEREAQGKTAEGKLTLRAATAGESVLIEIADDGRGIDRERVAARAQAKGLIDASADLNDAALLELICAPGFSTRDEADRGSGRGVGMDVVRNTVEELGGSISLETESGRGTRFTIELPLTLAIAEALIVSVNAQRFAVPQSAVREVIEVESATVKMLENNEIIPYRGGVLPLVRLARLFDMEVKRESAFHVFVLGSGASALGVAVDRIVGQREIVVRGIGDPLVQVAGIGGATELGDEQVVLILDVAALRQLATNGHLSAGRGGAAHSSERQ
jgi:two-component system chemotaxis sensor kinase CheA